MIFSSFTLTGKLNGSTTVEFSAGVASFTDLSIDHEDKNYVLNIEAFTIPPSRYQYSKNADPFDVKERVLALFITQQPGKLAARVASVSSLSVKATSHRKQKEEFLHKQKLLLKFKFDGVSFHILLSPLYTYGEKSHLQEKLTTSTFFLS